jgi:hypothetical protein
MDEASRQILQRFASSANKTHLESDDYLRFCDLSIYIHHHALNVTGPQIRAFLCACGFSAEVALRLGLQYERYRELLARYDHYDISAAHS